MPLDPLFLIAIAGMVLAVVVIAIFFRPTKDDNAEDLPAAVSVLIFEDDHALLRRHSCPECGAVLRQEATLQRPGRPHQAARAETGLSPGRTTCPACGAYLNISAEEINSEPE
jgi:predicted RNA-binding Zn-ribbon protein involved in translation (DUF1610 family)